MAIRTGFRFTARSCLQHYKTADRTGRGKAQKEAYLAVFPDAQDLTEPDNKEELLTEAADVPWIRPDLAQLTLWKIFIWQKRTEQ